MDEAAIEGPQRVLLKKIPKSYFLRNFTFLKSHESDHGQVIGENVLFVALSVTEVGTTANPKLCENASQGMKKVPYNKCGAHSNYR